VERLGVRRDHGRDQADVPGQRRDPGCDEHRVEPSADLVRAAVRLGPVGGLQAEPVLDRDEVEQAALGLLHQAGPVTRREQLAWPCLRLAPRGRMPATAVESHGQVQCGHVLVTCGSRRSSARSVSSSDPRAFSLQI